MKRFGGKKCGTDCDGHEKEIVMVRARENSNTKQNNVRAVAEMKMEDHSTLVEMEIFYQLHGLEHLEDQRRMGLWKSVRETRYCTMHKEKAAKGESNGA